MTDRSSKRSTMACPNKGQWLYVGLCFQAYSACYASISNHREVFMLFCWFWAPMTQDTCKEYARSRETLNEAWCDTSIQTRGDRSSGLRILIRVKWDKQILMPTGFQTNFAATRDTIVVNKCCTPQPAVSRRLLRLSGDHHCVARVWTFLDLGRCLPRPRSPGNTANFTKVCLHTRLGNLLFQCAYPATLYVRSKLAIFKPVCSLRISAFVRLRVSLQAQVQ